MKVCVPSTSPGGPEAPIGAPFKETDLLDYYELRPDGEFEHLAQMRNCGGGACIEPVEAIRHRGVESVIVASLGPDTLLRFHNYGIKVFAADGPSVRAALGSLAAGGLREITIGEFAHLRNQKR
jgi:predicted Fe-Mo cluster-binding NifX family protein